MTSSGETVLILGTDLAGKDHCANVLTDEARAAEIPMERRRGAFSAPADEQRTSENKSALNLWTERLFLAGLPLYCRLLPYATALLIWRDLRRFRRPAEGSILVISHTAVRLLAFALGHLFARVEDIRMPGLADRALRAIIPATGARVLVLDIDHAVRAARTAARSQRGRLDYFDRYMARSPVRAERIEHFLVWIGVTYLHAIRIENNNLSDVQLLEAMSRRLPLAAHQTPGAERA